MTNPHTAHHIDGPGDLGQITQVLIVGVNASDAGTCAVQTAVHLARQLNAHLRAVHVRDADDTPVDPDNSEWEADTEDAVARIRARTLGSLQQAGWDHWSYCEYYGAAARRIREDADTLDAAFIVIGVPRRDLLARIGEALGDTVAAQLIHQADRPVLSVPATS